jgi:hypothetical protein
MSSEQLGQLAIDCRSAMEGVRGALINLYASVECDPSDFQAAAKRFGLNKTLTWKFSKIISSDDPYSAIQHLPGEAGIGIFLSTFASSGAPAGAIEAVREAMAEFSRVVEEHATGRDDFNLMLDSMGLGAPDRQLEASRELAFRGNSGICGLQARTRLMSAILVPSKNGSGHADSAIVGGFVGLRRFRSSVRWPLFHFSGYSGDAGNPDHQSPTSLGDDGPRILSEFCSKGELPIETVTTEKSIEKMLVGGEVGNRGAFDCYFGSIARGLSMYRTETDTRADLYSMISLPIEHLVFDILYHRSLPVPVPQMTIYNRVGRGLQDMVTGPDDDVLPIQMPITILAGSPPAVATALVPRYTEMFRVVCERMGVNPSEMRGYRFSLRWPPLSSIANVSWALPEKRV